MSHPSSDWLIIPLVRKTEKYSNKSAQVKIQLHVRLKSMHGQIYTHFTFSAKSN